MKSPRKLMLLIAIALPTLHGCGSQQTQIPSGQQPVLLSISPIDATVAQGATQEFSVSITGTSNTAVTWSVVEGATAEVNQQAASLASTEVYDTATGTFSPAGDMAVARGGHAATLLQDGRLLITGGYAAAGPSTTVASSAELYQPSTGVFASAGKMTTSREEHTATLLTNGQILIAGGATPNTILATAELYDPAAGTFTGTGSMATPRTGHSATLLQDGTVLVSGGDQSDGSVIPVYLSSAEIFLPLR